MTQTQVTLSRPRTPDEYRDILHSNLEEFERLGRMIADMLFLAKADENPLAHISEPIDLTREANTLIDFHEALADERQVRIVRQGQASVQGDRLMLRRALSNLISNALRPTPIEGQIAIRIDADTAGVRLAVSNVGDPVPTPIRSNGSSNASIAVTPWREFRVVGAGAPDTRSSVPSSMPTRFHLRALR